MQKVGLLIAVVAVAGLLGANWIRENQSNILYSAIQQSHKKEEVAENLHGLLFSILSDTSRSKGIFCVTNLPEMSSITRKIAKEFEASSERAKSLWIDSNEIMEAKQKVFEFIKSNRNYPLLIQVEQSLVDSSFASFMEGIIDDSSPTVRYNGESSPAKSVTIVVYYHMELNDISSVEQAARDSVRGLYFDRFLQRFSDFVVLRGESKS